MRTIPFGDILNWLARRMLGDEANLTAQFAKAYIDMINSAVRDGWEREFWPEWTLIEQRYYRAAWSAGTYTAGTELYHTGTYWRALSDTATEPVTGAAAWEECGVNGAALLAPYIALDQAGQNVIGTPRGLYSTDPRANQGAAEIPFGLGALGVEVRAPARRYPSAWLEFRLPSPIFSSLVYNVGTGYPAGTRIYNPAGNYGELYGNGYVAIATVNPSQDPFNYPAQWQPIPLPYVLAEFVKLAAYAEALRDDGQMDKASVAEDYAEDCLATEWTKAESQTGAIRTFHVLTRRPPHGTLALRCA